MAMNRALIGKQYPPQSYRVSAEATTRYARAYNEDNPWFFDSERPGGRIAPPLYGVVVAGRGLAQAVRDPELRINFPLALHGEEDMEYLRPLRPGDEIITTARIESIDAKATGETLVLRVELKNQRDELVQRHRFSLFVRSGAGGGKKRELTPTTKSDEAPEPPVAVVEQVIDADQTFRYAEASGDRTPIHLDDEVAKKAGLPGIIVHGLCTMAFVSKAAIDHLCDGDPTRLARLAVRFARPVLPGRPITTHFWSAEDNGFGENGSDRAIYRFQTVDPEGAVVIRSGICEVRP